MPGPVRAGLPAAAVAWLGAGQAEGCRKQTTTIEMFINPFKEKSARNSVAIWAGQ